MEKPEVLKARWSKRENDVLIDFPNKPDGGFLQGWLVHARDRIYPDKSFLKLLEERGYDLTTLKFSIKKKG